MLGLWVLISIFTIEIFNCINFLLNISHNSTIFTVIIILIFVINFILFMKDSIKKKINIKLIIMMMFSIYIIISYIFQIAHNNYIISSLNTYVMLFITKSLSLFFIGNYIITPNRYSSLIKWLDPLMLFFTLSISLYIFNNPTYHSIQDISFGGNNYHAISYIGLYAFTLNFYSLIYQHDQKCKLFNTKTFYIIRYLLLVMQLYGIIYGGGRTEQVTLLGLLVLLFVLIIKKSKKKKIVILNTFLMIIAFFLVLPFLSHIPIINIAAERFKTLINYKEQLSLSTEVSSISARLELQNIALEHFYQSPIFGSGITSVFYKVGYYSHGYLFDILVDGGIVLFVLFHFVIIKLFYFIVKLTKVNKEYNLLILFFLLGGFDLLFNGYYINNIFLWFLLGGGCVSYSKRPCQFKCVN